jgi:hypothetical protein
MSDAELNQSLAERPETIFDLSPADYQRVVGIQAEADLKDAQRAIDFYRKLLQEERDKLLGEQQSHATTRNRLADAKTYLIIANVAWAALLACVVAIILGSRH